MSHDRILEKLGGGGMDVVNKVMVVNRVYARALRRLAPSLMVAGSGEGHNSARVILHVTSQLVIDLR